jgi:hypothetical protein
MRSLLANCAIMKPKNILEQQIHQDIVETHGYTTMVLDHISARLA